MKIHGKHQGNTGSSDPDRVTPNDSKDPDNGDCNGNGMAYYKSKRYLDEQRGKPLGDVWTDIAPLNSQAQERLGFARIGSRVAKLYAVARSFERSNREAFYAHHSGQIRLG
jgi:hypothetical protein